MRILIAEDDALLRAGLAALLEDEGYEVVTASGVAEFLASARAKVPDLAILDVRMPPTFTDEGIRAAVEVREMYPNLPILVLSAWVEQSFATQLLAQGSRGIGYLLKERVGRVEQFLSCLERLVAGETVIDPEVVAQLFARERAAAPMASLSEREREVLSLMAEGLGNSAIAARMFVTEGAVHKHIRNIFSKLDLPPDHESDRRVMAVLQYLQTDSIS
ncbi:Oxygen regulatory protein NreC [Corynebacterium kalinowskii]|uniref:Oxygen regulatory protein NreC n=1 Tax=Corynebacterium kalinowskii TaxID=2675216 RepID=A0A6B8VNI3_9CORY|nr:response regulator transcription factor [Corynebacterium kalinowskii]QGU01341.1 Oxygen regulatory protein NreC [Corynebacterium kalinowskii]